MNTTRLQEPARDVQLHSMEKLGLVTLSGGSLVCMDYIWNLLMVQLSSATASLFVCIWWGSVLNVQPLQSPLIPQSAQTSSSCRIQQDEEVWADQASVWCLKTYTHNAGLLRRDEDRCGDACCSMCEQQVERQKEAVRHKNKRVDLIKIMTTIVVIEEASEPLQWKLYLCEQTSQTKILV